MPKNKSITRRDFLNGVAYTALTVGVSAPLGRTVFAAGMQTSDGAPYPPRLTGMRGNHPGSYDHAHPLAWYGEAPKIAKNTNEEYDLVVVGGGISGLAAALMFRRERGPDQRILILDNHDDFGGHAKRNEFISDGKMLLSVGGAVNMEDPQNVYSDEALQLLNEIGLDLDKLAAGQQDDGITDLFGSNSGMYLKDKDGTGSITVGKWVKAYNGLGNYKELIEQLPIPQSEKDKIIKLASGDWDYLVGLSLPERLEYLSTTPYHQFLREKVGLSEKYLTLFDTWVRLSFGVGGEATSAHEAMMVAAPGMGSVGWPWGLAQDLFMGGDEPPIKTLIFPDGNASVARMMVRTLIPEVAPGTSIDDITTARFDYGKLDTDGSPVRLRLNSTAIRAKQNGEQVTVTYVKDNKPYNVKAKHCVLACYNSIIPHICPELPQKQKEGLKYGVKVPFVWASVVVKDGDIFKKAGTDFVNCPDSYFGTVSIAPMTKMADYQAPSGPGGPRVIFMMRAPAKPLQGNQTPRDVYRQARRELLATSFDDIEAEIKAQLNEVFANQAFDAEQEIEAITVNRWAHGYAYSYMELFDSFDKGNYPYQVGRKQFGRISIANTDAAGQAYLNVAIDQAWRAVQEQLYISR